MHTCPWGVYDDLIDLLPDVAVAGCTLGQVALVTTEDGGAGMASRQRGGPRTPMSDRHFAGRKVRDVAALVRSWDLELASLGTAAINCCLNTPDRLAAHGGDAGDADVFGLRAEELRGLSVAMVGHFERAVRLLEHICTLTVLERDPHGADLPDPACEYVLPGADVVFITGMTVGNKTLPRLLELSAPARTVLTGPSVPFAPEVFGAEQVQEIAGACVTDAAMAGDLVRAGAIAPEMRAASRRFCVSLHPSQEGASR